MSQRVKCQVSLAPIVACVLLVAATLGCESKTTTKVVTKAVKKTPPSKKPPKRLKTKAKESAKAAIDPKKQAEARVLLSQGEALLKKGSKEEVQQARKILYQATKMDPSLFHAQLALASASLKLGNKPGALSAAKEALYGMKTPLDRIRALHVLRSAVHEKGSHWNMTSFFDEYIAENARLLDPKDAAVWLKDVPGTIKKKVEQGHQQRDKALARQLCETPSVVGPVSSPKALCAYFEAEYNDSKCKWGRDPEVSSALQVLPMTIEREDSSMSFMAVGKKNKWHAVLLTERRHATSGFVHESLKTRLYATRRAGDVMTLRAAARKRRGDEDDLLGMFYRSEEESVVWCVLETSLNCKRYLTRARRSIYATKLVSGKSRHTLLVEYGPDAKMSWDKGPQQLPKTCPLGPALNK